MSIRGYHYGSHFKSVVAIDYDKSRAKVKYNNNWITFSDALVHFSLLKIISRDLLLPTHIQAIHCDPRLMAQSFAENQTQEVLSNLKGNYVLSNGLEMYGFRYAKAIRRPSEQELLLERYKWVPYMDSNAYNEDKKLLVETYIKLIESLSENKPKEEIDYLLNGVHYLLILNEMNDKCLVLKDILENINSIPDLFTTDGRRLSSDLLNNLYFDESLIRPAIDIVLENTSISSNQDFNVLEINLNQENCYKYVINYLKDSFNNLNVKYSLYNPIETDVKTNSSELMTGR